MNPVNSGGPGRFDRADADLGGEDGPVRSHRRHLAAPPQQGTVTGGQEPLEAVAVRVAQLRRDDDVGQLAAEDVGGGEPEGVLRGRVELVDAALVVHRDDGVQRRSEDRALSVLAVAEGLDR